jgi:hypothetical protein
LRVAAAEARDVGSAVCPRRRVIDVPSIGLVIITKLAV